VGISGPIWWHEEHQMAESFLPCKESLITGAAAEAITKDAEKIIAM